jgi:hypothetical protein
LVSLNDACVSELCLGGPKGLAEIDITVGENPNPPEARAAATLRGIHLGSPATLIARYRVTDHGGAACGAGTPPPATTYIVPLVHTTLAITTHDGLVAAIALIQGRHPRFCSTQ